MAAGVFRAKWHFVAGRTVARDPSRVVDFGQVMVFGRHPKDRNEVESATRHFIRDSRRGDGFVERERRPGEKADLLAREDRPGAVREALEIARSSCAQLVGGRESLIL